jgi:hypothetical protein
MGNKRGQATLMKTCKRCFRKFEESEADVEGVSLATELADYLDSCFHGNDKEDHGNDKEDHGNDREGCGNDRGNTDIGVEDINVLCPQCREELGNSGDRIHIKNL